MTTSYDRDQVTAVILAGGRARRMGGQDKGLIEINGTPMVEYVLAALEPQVDRIVINANRNLERYLRYGWPVVTDELSDFQGPLAGIASSMAKMGTPYLLTAPCDSPLLPADLGWRLYEALVKDEAEIAVAHDGDRMQPVFSLINRDLHPSLLAFLEEGERKIDLWHARHRLALADFSDRPETFLNVNTPQDCASLGQRLTTKH